MNVILVEPFAHRVGHYSAEAWKLAQSLSKSGVDITLVSFNGIIDKRKKDIQESNFKHISFFSHAGAASRLVVDVLHKILSLINSSRLIDRLITNLETFSTLMTADHIFRSEKADIIYCNDGELIGFLLYASSIEQRKLLYKRLEYGRSLSLNGSGIGRRAKRYIENRLCKETINKNRVIFTYNVKELGIVYKETGFSGDCIYVPPHGVAEPKKKLKKSEARSYLNLPVNETILLVFGTGHGGKDFETILRANVGADGKYRILFAGNVPSSSINNPRQLARKYNCERNVTIVDKYITDDEVPYYFCSADALLLSYRKEFTVDSGVLLQGVSYGLPVIASDSGWIGEIATKKGLGVTFNSESPSSLREAIDNFLQLSEDSKVRIRENMQTFAESFSWDTVVDEHLKIMRKFLQ